MLPSETIILLSMATSCISNFTLNHTIDIMSEYIEYLYNSLVVHGFIENIGLNKYRLTSLGEKELAILSNENRKQTFDVMRALKRLGIESINSLEKLNVEVTMGYE